MFQAFVKMKDASEEIAGYSAPSQFARRQHGNSGSHRRAEARAEIDSTQGNEVDANEADTLQHRADKQCISFPFGPPCPKTTSSVPAKASISSPSTPTISKTEPKTTTTINTTTTTPISDPTPANPTSETQATTTAASPLANTPTPPAAAAPSNSGTNGAVVTPQTSTVVTTTTSLSSTAHPTEIAVSTISSSILIQVSASTESNGVITSVGVNTQTAVSFSGTTPLVLGTNSRGAIVTVPYGADPIQPTLGSSSSSSGVDTDNTPPAAAGTSSKKNDAGAIAGGIVGALLFVLLISAALFMSRRRQRSRVAPSSEFLATGESGVRRGLPGSSPFQFERIASNYETTTPEAANMTQVGRA